MPTNDIVIINAYRSPVGSFNGYFKDTPTPVLGAAVIRHCVEQAHVSADQINAVVMGCVLPAGLGQAPARQAAIKAGLSIHTPCAARQPKPLFKRMTASKQAHTNSSLPVAWKT